MLLNPFPPSVPIWHRLADILILEGIIKKIYERRDYESVDEKSLILGYVPENDEKKNSG